MKAAITVRVGRTGTSLHSMIVRVADGKVFTGPTWCGSQSFGAGAAVVTLDDSKVNCGRCARTIFPNDLVPADSIVALDARGRLVAK